MVTQEYTCNTHEINLDMEPLLKHSAWCLITIIPKILISFNCTLGQLLQAAPTLASSSYEDPVDVGTCVSDIFLEDFASGKMSAIKDT